MDADRPPPGPTLRTKELGHQVAIVNTCAAMAIANSKQGTHTLTGNGEVAVQWALKGGQLAPPVGLSLTPSHGGCAYPSIVAASSSTAIHLTDEKRSSVTSRTAEYFDQRIQLVDAYQSKSNKSKAGDRPGRWRRREMQTLGKLLKQETLPELGDKLSVT
jgi:hypothetical protein